MTEGIRLQKYLSRAGRASRREAEAMMLDGRVEVNGAPATELGIRVVPGADTVTVDGAEVAWPSQTRWIAMNKESGLLTTRTDPHGGKTVYDVLPEDCSALRYVGRLDRDTEGLLLLTSDGDVAHALQHPSRQVEREYEVLVGGVVGPEALAALHAGVPLEDGPARAKRATILERDERWTRLRLVMTEGRKREVRRMMKAIDHSVRRLTRVRFGPQELGDLAPGTWRELTEAEQARLRAAAGNP